MSTASGSSERILILSSSTGGGHQSAAWALQESFNRLSPGQVLVNITQVLEEAHFVTRHLADLYNYLLRYHQHYMRYYYWTIEKIRPYESNMLFQMSYKYGMQLFERIAPTKLVSVHPMTQHFFAYVLKKLRLIDKIPLITVVTDPCRGFWKGWACPEVSQYFVAHEEAKEQLTRYGIAPDKIMVSGMPVHARFQPVTSHFQKQQLRQSLGLDPNKFTVLVNAGWVGGGNTPSLFQTLLNYPLDNLQIVFLSGQNQMLYHEALQMAAKSRQPVFVQGYTENLADWMKASDVMISKLGGLSTFEAMACELPIFGDCLTPPMPQEVGTASLISRNGAGTLITEPQQVLNELENLIRMPDKYADMKSAAKALGKPGAVDAITTQIMQQGRF